MNKIYTVAEAAKYLGVAANTVRANIKSGKLKAKDLSPQDNPKNSIYRITQESLDEYMNN